MDRNVASHFVRGSSIPDFSAHKAENFGFRGGYLGLSSAETITPESSAGGRPSLVSRASRADIGSLSYDELLSPGILNRVGAQSSSSSTLNEVTRNVASTTHASPSFSTSSRVGHPGDWRRRRYCAPSGSGIEKVVTAGACQFSESSVLVSTTRRPRNSNEDVLTNSNACGEAFINDVAARSGDFASDDNIATASASTTAETATTAKTATTMSSLWGVEQEQSTQLAKALKSGISSEIGQQLCDDGATQTNHTDIMKAATNSKCVGSSDAAIASAVKTDIHNGAVLPRKEGEGVVRDDLDLKATDVPSDISMPSEASEPTESQSDDSWDIIMEGPLQQRFFGLFWRWRWCVIDRQELRIYSTLEASLLNPELPISRHSVTDFVAMLALHSPSILECSDRLTGKNAVTLRTGPGERWEELVSSSLWLNGFELASRFATSQPTSPGSAHSSIES